MCVLTKHEQELEKIVDNVKKEKSTLKCINLLKHYISDVKIKVFYSDDEKDIHHEIKKMNILSDNDLKTYMFKKEMYVTKEIVNSNFKTEFDADSTYFIDGIDIEWVDEDTVVCYIYSGNIECSFHRTCSKLDFYAEMKKLFIQIKEMYEVWKSS